jgi:hypothetical protein
VTHLFSFFLEIIGLLKNPSPQISQEYERMPNLFRDRNSREPLRIFSPFTNSLKGIAEDLFLDPAIRLEKQNSTHINFAAVRSIARRGRS